MTKIKNYKDFIVLESLDVDSIKGNIEDILVELNDLGLKTNVIYDEKEGMKFYEILIYSNREFKRDAVVIDAIRRVSRYLSQEYNNPFLDIQMFRINNSSFYSTDGDKANIDHNDRLYKWYFGFIVNEPDGYYVKVPSFWHHNNARMSYNHKIDPSIFI